MTNTTLAARLRAAGLDPALFSDEELAFIADAAEADRFPLPAPRTYTIPAADDAQALLGELRAAARACLDAVSPGLHPDRESLRRTANDAAAALGRRCPDYAAMADTALAAAEVRHRALTSAINHEQNTARALVCLLAAAKINHRETAEDAIAAAILHHETVREEYTAARDALERWASALSSLPEEKLPALLEAAAPLFAEGDSLAGFSPDAFRAAALRLRNTCEAMPPIE